MARIPFPIHRRDTAGLGLGATVAETDTAAEGNRSASFGAPNRIFVGENNQLAALSVSAWHRGVELRARTMAMLSVEYQKVNAATGGNYILDDRGPVARRYNYLFQVQPNPLTSWVDMMQLAEARRIMEGNAVIYIERDDSGELRALWLCNTATYNLAANTYNVTYYGIGGIKVEHDIAPSQVIHIRNTFRTPDGMCGISTLRYASRSLSLSATNDQQALDNSAKGGKMKLLVQENGKKEFGMGRVAKDQMKKITSQLNDDLYESDVVMLSNVANVTPISQTSQAMELLQSRAFSVSDVARFLGVPKFLLMDDSGSSYKSPEAATQEFLQRTIAPSIREWECELNSKLLGEVGYPVHRFHLCELPLLRLDLKAQADIDKLQLETGVRSVNELRQRYDLPAIKDGDIHYVSTNLAEVGSAKLGAPAAQPAASASAPSSPASVPTPKKGGNS